MGLKAAQEGGWAGGGGALSSGPGPTDERHLLTECLCQALPVTLIKINIYTVNSLM